MTKVPFTKAAATPEQLLQKLKARGLHVDPAAEAPALAYLRGVGAYRLKGYWFHLVDPVTKCFPAGYTFEQIAARYECDRELRAATIAAIDRLEVAIRAVMANALSLKHSPHWFLEPRVFRPTREWGMGHLIRKIESEVGRGDGKRFVGHYFSHYEEPYLPPSWAVSECVSFGFWSKTYAILRDPHDKRAISKRFGVDQVEVFESWIHTLTVVRNLAAHHGQLLRVKLGVAPANYKSQGIKFADQKSFFAAATVVNYLLNQTQLPHSWKADIEGIFLRFPGVPPADLGFPAGWGQFPAW